ncbi:MAG: hypothetical protein ACRD59_17845 [Candidatus Acidiferrales bacterium]
MPADPNRKPLSGFRNPLLYTSTLLIFALLYAAGTLYFRREQNREMEQRAAEAEAARRRSDDARTVEQLGGNEFKILNFYAMPGIVKHGQAVQLCYGVSNAKTVKLEPQSKAVWPSFSRCLEVTPSKTTEYTLTAEDGNGTSKSSTVKVIVQ